jgi:hypothetical protein
VKAFRNSAPSSVGLTGKRLLSRLSWLSYSSSGIYPDRRVWSATRSRLSPGRELPTPAKLNEPRGPGPLGQDLHPLCVTAAFPARGEEGLSLSPRLPRLAASAPRAHPIG